MLILASQITDTTERALMFMFSMSQEPSVTCDSRYPEQIRGESKYYIIQSIPVDKMHRNFLYILTMTLELNLS